MADLTLVTPQVCPRAIDFLQSPHSRPHSRPIWKVKTDMNSVTQATRAGQIRGTLARVLAHWRAEDQFGTRSILVRCLWHLALVAGALAPQVSYAQFLLIETQTVNTAITSTCDVSLRRAEYGSQEHKYQFAGTCKVVATSATCIDGFIGPAGAVSGGGSCSAGTPGSMNLFTVDVELKDTYNVNTRELSENIELTRGNFKFSANDRTRCSEDPVVHAGAACTTIAYNTSFGGASLVLNAARAPHARGLTTAERALSMTPVVPTGSTAPLTLLNKPNLMALSCPSGWETQAGKPAGVKEITCVPSKALVSCPANRTYYIRTGPVMGCE